MSIKKAIFIGLILAFFSTTISAQKTVTLLKRLDDDAGRYGQKIATSFENKPGDAAKQKALEPFVIGYYGWKAKILTQFGVGKIEAAHLNICRIILGLYDKEIDGTLTTIVGRAKTPTDWVEVSEAEQKTIHNFVVMKYSGKYLGLNDVLSGKTSSSVTESDKWKSMLGASLGEIGGSFVNWYKFPTSADYPKRIAQMLLNLQENIRSAPSGTSPELLANLRKLSAFGNKTTYNEAERDQAAAALRDALFSTLSFANLENSSVNSTTNSGNLTNAQQAANFLESGKASAAKKDFGNAVIAFNEAIKLDATNGTAYYHRAKALEELGKIDEAISDYTFMIAFETDLVKAFYNRGTLYSEKKIYRLAIEDFNSALKLDPKHKNAFYNRGATYFDLKDYDKAIADFTQVITLNPTDKDAFDYRALSYCKKGQTNLALKDQEQAIKLGAKITKGCQ